MPHLQDRQRALSVRKLQFESLEPRQLCAVNLSVDPTVTYIPSSPPALIAPHARLNTTEVANFSRATLDVTLRSGGRASDFTFVRNEGSNAGQIAVNGPALFYNQDPIGALNIGPSPIGTPYVYKSAEGRKLSLYVNAPHNTDQNRPAILLFYGGDWNRGNPGSLNHQAAYLASRGMVAILVDFRSIDVYGYEPPTICIQDAKSAMRWVRSHAAAFRIDPHRIAAGGYSTGGHLAAFTGIVDGMDDPHDNLSISAKADALVLLSPNINLGPDRYKHDHVGDDYRLYSPEQNVTADDPPSIIFVGSADVHVPVSDVISVTNRLNQLGVYAEAHVFKDQGHEVTVYRWDNWYYYQTWRLADAFLVRLGWLSGTPTLHMPSSEPPADKAIVKRLTMTLGSKATPEALQALLRNITFQSGAPANLDRAVYFDLIDRHGVETVAKTDLVPNRPPALTSSENPSVQYQANSPPIALMATASVADSTSPDFAGGNLRVALQSGGNVSDRILIRGAFTLSGTQVQYQGTTIGTMNQGGGIGTTPLLVNLNPYATPALVQLLIRSLRYRTVGVLTGQRVVGITANDGDGGTSNTLTKTINVV